MEFLSVFCVIGTRFLKFFNQNMFFKYLSETNFYMYFATLFFLKT